MRVEWYIEDFSDPEAVSGSSTNLNLAAIWLLFVALKVVGGGRAFSRWAARGGGFWTLWVSGSTFCQREPSRDVKKRPVENSIKNHKNCVQKVIDLSTLGAYNRDSS